MTRLDLVRHLTTVMYHRQISAYHALGIFMMAEKPHGLTMTEFIRSTGLANTTARRTLSTLINQGFATRSEGKRPTPHAHIPYLYHLTPEGTRLGTELLTPNP